MDPIHPIRPIAPDVSPVAPAPAVQRVAKRADQQNQPGDERRRRQRPAPRDAAGRSFDSLPEEEPGYEDERDGAGRDDDAGDDGHRHIDITA